MKDGRFPLPITLSQAPADDCVDLTMNVRSITLPDTVLKDDGSVDVRATGGARMIDREALLAMFDRAGVVYGIADSTSDWSPWSHETGPQWASMVMVEQGAGDRNVGYAGFETTFFFDSAGALVGMGAWE